MLRFKLRTLLILLALLPPLLAGAWSIVAAKITEWRQPAVTWEEATRLAAMVQSGGGTFIIEDKAALGPPLE